MTTCFTHTTFAEKLPKSWCFFAAWKASIRLTCTFRTGEHKLRVRVQSPDNAYDQSAEVNADGKKRCRASPDREVRQAALVRSLCSRNLSAIVPEEINCRSDRAGRTRRRPRNLTHSRTFRNRSEFVITETELKLIAAAARIGLRRIPNKG